MKKVEFKVLVPYCNGEDIFDVWLETPKVKLTGRKGIKGKEKLFEVEFNDYEPTVFRCKPRTTKIFVNEENFIFIR